MNLPYAVGLLISAVTSAAIALIAWKRRSAPGASGLMFSMLADLIWATTYAVRWMMTEPSTQLFWLDATYFGVAFNSTFVLIFTLQFTNRSHLLTRRNLIFSAIVPFVTLLLLWTDKWHGLFFGGQHSTGTILSGGAWFWFFVLYSYTQIFVVIALFVQAYLRSSSLYRLQTGAILFAACLPVAGNILSFAGISPFPNLDLTPFIFTISGLIYAYALFGLLLLDVVPIARHKLVDEMTDGVIVLDASKCIVDINPAAERLIGISSSAIGQLSTDILKETLHLDQAGDLITAALTELRISEDPPRDIDLQILPLFDHRQSITGHLLILRDITARKKTEETLMLTRKSMESASDSLFWMKPNGSIVDVNETACRSLGYTREELLQLSVPDVDAHYTADVWAQHFPELRKHGTLKLESEQRAKDGRLIPVEIVANYVQQGDEEYNCAFVRDITERKQAEEFLRQSEARFRNVLQNVQSISVQGYGPDGTTQYWNQASEQLYGYTAQEAMGRNLLDLIIPPDMQSGVKQAIQHMAETGQPIPASELSLMRKDGSRVLVFSNHTILQLPGQPQELFCIDIDITERKQVEEAVRVSEERYRLLANNVPDIIYSLNGEGNIVTVNSSAFERYGYTEQDSMGKSFLSFIHPEDREIIMTSFVKAMEEQRIFTHGLQFRIVAENGVRHWVELNSQARFDSQGGYAGEDGVLRNITERKQAEEKLAQLNHLNELILSSAAEGVLGLDTNGKHTFVNTAAARMLGYSAEELLGCSSHKTWHHTKPDGSPYPEEECGIHAAYRDGTVHRSSNDLIWRKDGTSFWVEYASTPLYENGCLAGAVLTFEDVTERKRAEQVLQESAERIQKDAADLTLAYDKTLEGWARALELRDQETEGHTRRVVQMTVDLARAIGIGEDELENVRRGALLHDIGKMGIPDSVLLKPGTLNERELEIMRRHAEYAYELLKPIEYLRLSLDIPYCHHEKWDGGGYPRGLKGEEIPLVARIFAVVDVWDALTSDRPYRKAWSYEQTIKYIQEQSGKHFDPRISAEFLNMVSKVPPQSN